jgi:hypothetical protein
VPSGRRKKAVEQAAAKRRGEGAERPHDLGDLGRYWLLNAAVARVSAARNDITAAEAPQKWGEAAKVGGIYI